MRRSPVLSALERHYKAIWGRLRQIEEEIVNSGHVGEALRERMQPEIAPRQEALAHIEFCLRLFEPEWRRDRLQPVKPRKRADPETRRKLLNWAFDVLRDATEPMSSTDILEELWKRDLVSYKEKAEWGTRLTGLLRRQERWGTIVSYGRSPLLWAIFRPPQAGHGKG